MSNYPFSNPVSNILHDFKFGRIVALVLSGSHIAFTCYQFSEPANGTQFWTYVHLIVSALVFAIMYHVMFVTAPLKQLEDAVTEKARYEDVLYVVLVRIIGEQDSLVREQLLAAYINRLITLQNTDHQSHLEHLHPVLKQEVFRVCQQLIEDEKASLCALPRNELSSTVIRDRSSKIALLEAVAASTREILPKFSAIDMPSLRTI